MIRYALRCGKGHDFEAWFRSSAAFDDQADTGRVLCPSCGSTDVSKALMAPAVGKGGVEPSQPVVRPQPAVGTGGPSPAHSLTTDPKAKALVEAIRQLRRQVAENADYVGERFPEEARRIHHEESERRNIYGEASPEEARELIEEGIEIHALPRLPDEQN